MDEVEAKVMKINHLSPEHETPSLVEEIVERTRLWLGRASYLILVAGETNIRFREWGFRPPYDVRYLGCRFEYRFRLSTEANIDFEDIVWKKQPIRFLRRGSPAAHPCKFDIHEAYRRFVSGF